MKLRPYQETLISQARALMQSGCKSLVIQSATGSGKTLLTAHMLKTAQGRGLTSWFICHRRELIHQSVAAFKDMGVDVGVISAGFESHPERSVQVCSIQTLAGRVDRLKKPHFVVWDECAHQAARTWSEMYTRLDGAYHIGLTATPERLDGSGLDRFYTHMIHGPSVRWLIDNKFLSEFRVFAPPTVSTAGLHTRMGDYVKEEVNALMDKPTITGSAIEMYRKHTYGRRALGFAASIEHSKHVVEQFNAFGIPAEHVDGDTKPEVRDNAIERFRKGITLVLSNCDIFLEGFDCPAAEVAIILRPSKSECLVRQMYGRVLRTYPGKSEAIILDHVGNVARHGFPDDGRVWTLKGREANRRTVEACKSVRVCSRCFAAMWSGGQACTFCGFVFEVESREVRQVDGELFELDRQAIAVRRKHEQRGAQSMSELIQIGRDRKYKNPTGWAWHYFNARNRAVAR